MKRNFILCLILCLSFILSCDKEKSVVDQEAKQTTASYNITDVSFYTADITVNFVFGDDFSNQSEFGLLLTKSKDVFPINSVKYPFNNNTGDNSYSITISKLDTSTTYFYRSYIYSDISVR